MCLIFHFYICLLFVCRLRVTEMRWLGLGTVSSYQDLATSRKACMCGNIVSKHNLEWSFNGESVSKIYLCEDCWQPNNCLYYVKDLLSGNEVRCEQLLSFSAGDRGPRYWFFWEVPCIFERWSCCGDGWYIGRGMQISAVINWIYFDWTQSVIFWILQYVVLLTQCNVSINICIFLFFTTVWCFICVLLFCLNLWGQWLKWQLQPSLSVPVFLMKCSVLGRDAEINWTKLMVMVYCFIWLSQQAEVP